MRQEEHIDDAGCKTIYVYDDLNRHCRTTDFDRNGKVTCDIQYQHIDKTKLVSGWKVYKPEGVLFLSFEVEYNSDGTEKETREYNNRGELEMRTTNVFDKISGQYIEKSYDADGNELKPFE